MKKKFVNIEDNRTHSYLIDHVKIGSNVVVVDGSYMVNARTKDHVSGIYFKSGFSFELLTVTRINIPFKTDYCKGTEDILGHHNNCEITGHDGEKYYCSSINIKVFTT